MVDNFNSQSNKSERIAYYVKSTKSENFKYLKIAQTNGFGKNYFLTDNFYSKTLFNSVDDARDSAMEYIKLHKTCTVVDLIIVEVIIEEREISTQPFAPNECIFYPLSWGKTAAEVINDDDFISKCFMTKFKTLPKSFDKKLYRVYEYGDVIYCYSIEW